VWLRQIAILRGVPLLMSMCQSGMPPAPFEQLYAPEQLHISSEVLELQGNGTF
jgi:hypothetical protein